ncbi:MAG: outer membrane protein assembly factor BamE [Alphaproteobacteria bacterium]|nr:outer membrane protein assembly factor BamE [Alphaproteobacteria bacterium]
MAGMVGCTLLAAACTPVVANRGNMVDADRLAEIKAGVSTREEVAVKLGSPSHIAALDENTWYYIGRRTEQYAFFDPEVTEQQVVLVTFDDAGIVKDIEKIDTSGAKDISPVQRATPTFGRETTLIQDLFGNVGRPGAPKKGGK